MYIVRGYWGVQLTYVLYGVHCLKMDFLLCLFLHGNVFELYVYIE